MAERKELGRIKSVRVGFGGYQGVMFGASFDLGGGGWGVGDFWGTWAPSHVKVTESTKWTESDRDRDFADVMRKLSDMCKAGSVESVADLQGLPVEVTFDGGTLKSWRLLSEVLA